MSVLENLYRLMRTTGIYRLDGESLVDAELMSYGVSLQAVEDRLETILREGIIATAEDEGLSAMEAVMGKPDRGTLSPEDRRAMILYWLSILPGDFDLEGMKNALRSVGLSADILEDLPGERITVRQEEYRGARETFDMIMRDCEQMLPAHLEILFDLGALSWDGFDRQDLTFDARDACDLSWDQFEAQDEIE